MLVYYPFGERTTSAGAGKRSEGMVKGSMSANVVRPHRINTTIDVLRKNYKNIKANSITIRYKGVFLDVDKEGLADFAESPDRYTFERITERFRR